jgi:alcohol/geraniol dehydrogenase (NADP+)
MSTVKAWAAMEAGGKLQPFTYEMTALEEEQVEIEVEHCGICHTDLAFINNEWGTIPFPLVPGHEITGKILALGKVAKEKGLYIGQKVGLGWNMESCGHCDFCLGGDQNLCSHIKATIWGNHGGYASRVKAHWIWTIPIPENIDTADAGPLFCAGITVFSPLMEFGVRPTDKIGVFGIGGLGHLAIQFSHAWGAEVTAFSSNESKKDSILKLGADRVVSSRDSSEWESLKGSFDLILITVAVTLDWEKIIAMLAPKGRLNFVGIVYDPIPVSVIALLVPQASVSASPGGSRGTMDKMMRFAARHGIKPIVEHFPMSNVNEAIAYVESGKANYRVVLDADFE